MFQTILEHKWPCELISWLRIEICLLAKLAHVVSNIIIACWQQFATWSHDITAPEMVHLTYNLWILIAYNKF